jgi:hypothetical protein
VKDVLGKRLRFNPDDRALRIFGSAELQKITAGIVLGLKLVLYVHRRADARHRRRRRDEHHVRVGHRAHARDRLRKALGARRSAHPHAVPARGLTTTFAGGALGVALSYVLVWLTSPRPFLSEILDDTTGAGDIHLILSFELVGICTAILCSSGSSARSCPPLRASSARPDRSASCSVVTAKERRGRT